MVYPRQVKAACCRHRWVAPLMHVKCRRDPSRVQGRRADGAAPACQEQYPAGDATVIEVEGNMNGLATALAATAVAFLGLTGQAQAASPAATPAPAPAAAKAPVARKIPGINATDPYPKACVDCHVNKPPSDARLSTQLQQWMSGKVSPALLATVQGSAPAGLKLKGKHPDATDALDDVPTACADCHSEDSKKAPPLAGMVHRIHLVGGDKNHFMTEFQGECTSCHKLDAATGAWSVPSGPEKK
jgi:hypothetical protein